MIWLALTSLNRKSLIERCFDATEVNWFHSLHRGVKREGGREGEQSGDGRTGDKEKRRSALFFLAFFFASPFTPATQASDSMIVGRQTVFSKLSR